ncbi:MAG: leucine-rich repeat protein, partial [Lachnospiraceae bacterium]|nr:leucine-rich repeat protein [Lachnospiraceae bacterium]
LLSLLLVMALLFGSFVSVGPGVIKADAAGTATKADFTTKGTDDELVITGYTGKALELDLREIFKDCTIVGIDKEAFTNKFLVPENNYNITSIIIPNTCKTIGESAFEGCASLGSVKFAAQEGKTPAEQLTISDFAFRRCKMLATVELPNWTTVISSQAFRDTKITSLTNLTKCTTIGESAFWGCTNLESVVIPKTCQTIGAGAFKSCSGLTTVTFEKGNTALTVLNNGVFENCHKLNTVTDIPDTVTSIGDEAFESCYNLKKIVIPEAVETIGSRAFLANNNTNKSCLESVTFNGNKLTTINSEAFSYCKALKKISLPESVTTIGKGAFSYSGLQNIQIPKNVETIGEEAFYWCSNLQSVTFADTASDSHLTIGRLAFEKDNISEVTIPANCTQVQDYAFRDNPLTRVDFGENNVSIGSSAFYSSNSSHTDSKNVMLYGTYECSNVKKYAENGKYTFQVYSSKLEVEQKPDKVNYDLGEDLDTTGMVIRATYDKTAGKASTADSGTPDISDCVITGFDNKTVGTQKITVAYGDAKTTFDVNVRLNLAKLGTYGKVETPDATKTYNGKEITPSVKVSVKKADGTWRTLTSEKEYNKPVYKNNVNAYTGNTTGSGVSASAPSITVSGDGVYTTGKVTKYFNIDKRTMDDVTVSVADGSVYSGTEKKPEVTVTYNGKTVPSDQYNAVVYKNNINAAKSNDAEAPYVKVTASSNSNFKDSKIAYFGIDPLDLEKAEITVDTGKDQTYTGKTVKPEKVTVTRPDPKTSGETITLQSGKDYEVSAYNNNTNVGAATATLTGKGNYTGTYNTIYNIVPRKLDDASMEVSKLDEVTYDGKNHAPVVKVNYNRGTDDVVTLKEGTDYKVTLVASADAVLKEEKEAESDVITAVGKVGSYKVVVEGMGNYDGTVERTFTIKKIDLSDAKITVPEKNIYDGEAVCPELTVVKDGETLVKDQDYTVSYEDNEAVGTGKVIITGAGNYEGSCEAAFEIIGVPLFEEDGADNAEIAEIADQTYDPKGNTPAITVTKKGETLVQDKDYTVEYENNKAVGTAKVTITGIGKYSGKMEKEFKIVAADVKNAEISAISDQVYTGAEIKPEVTVTYGKKTVSGVTSREDWGTNATNNGTQLVAGKDYTVDYKDNVAAGTATVTVTGKGNYAGTLTKTFTIAAADIETAKISDIADQTYTGSALEPKVTVTYGEQDDAYELKADEDYTVAYKDNVAAGTATVTVTGKGNYAGTLTKTFTIAAADIKAAKISAVADQAYTGAAITPEVTVTYGNQNAVKLIAGTDYTVSYGNNVLAGTATITVTGKGNYAGTLTQTFTIVAPAPAPTPDVTTQETDAGIDDADLDGDDDAVVIPTVKKVKQVKVTAKKKALVLKWKKMSGVAKYQIQFSTKKNFKKAKTYNVKKSQTSVNIKKLKKATKYYVRIRACKTYTDEDDNDKTVYGAWVTVNKKTK